MQIEKVQCGGKPTNLVVKIESDKTQKIRLMAYNPKKPNTYYTNRVKTVDGVAQFEVRMPQNCETVFVRCLKDGTNEDVKILSCKKVKLNQFVRCIKPRVSSFVKFAQEFSEQLPLLSKGTYYSDDKKYRIDLFNVITNDGKPISTPARISNVDGRMEVSKSHFAKYTVPMRMAVLLHEFSHFNLNVVQEDEVEADLNALRIYLGMGYPTIEAHMSFLNVFKGTPSMQNKERYEYIKSFIDNFDEMKYRVCI